MPKCRLIILSNNNHVKEAALYLKVHGSQEDINDIIAFSSVDPGILKKELPIRNLVELRYMKLPWIGIPYNLIKSKLTLQKWYDEVVFSSYINYFHRLLMQSFPTDKNILLNDGVQTLTINYLRTEGKIFDYVINPNLKGFLKLDENFPLHYFSPYQIKETVLDKKLEYPINIITTPPSAEVHFIGSPYVEMGIMEENIYWDTVYFLISRFKNFRYFPHRREKIFLDKLDATIIQKTEDRYEDFIKSITPPKTIISVMSSVLFNLVGVLPKTEFHFIKVQPKNQVQRKELIKYAFIHENYIFRHLTRYNRVKLFEIENLCPTEAFETTLVEQKKN